VIYGGIEGGGTKWMCAVGTAPDEIQELVAIPTTTPEETLAAVVEFFAQHPVAAVGVGSFGPLDPGETSPRFGTITTTPKAGWSTNVRSVLAAGLGVPIAIETDVGAAALGEGRFGAARDVDTFCYITVGTGIGGGIVVRGELVHGLLHPELGTCASRTTSPATPSPAAAPTTATASKDWPRALPSSSASACPPTA
jgi:fructokinase